MAWRRWVWRLHILHLHLLLRQMHCLAEIHTSAFHQLRGSFKRWSSSCQLTVQIPLEFLAGCNFLNPAPVMLPPGFRLLTSNATQVGWESLPPLLAQKSLRWFSPAVTLQYFGDLTWQVSLHEEWGEALCSAKLGRRAPIPELPLN